jgi:hypothetical protein
MAQGEIWDEHEATSRPQKANRNCSRVLPYLLSQSLDKFYNENVFRVSFLISKPFCFRSSNSFSVNVMSAEVQLVLSITIEGIIRRDRTSASLAKHSSWLPLDNSYLQPTTTNLIYKHPKRLPLPLAAPKAELDKAIRRRLYRLPTEPTITH